MSRNRFAVSALASAVALAMAGSGAHALGLGGLRIQSALNQPFVGEIDLLDVKPDELDTVKAQLAPANDFSKAGAERFSFLNKLKFTPQISPRGNTVIRVSSREPIREPYMDFLVETVWPRGRLVRQYTVLLDPPVVGGRAAPRIEPPVGERQQVRASEPPQPGPLPARQRPSSPPPQPVPSTSFPRALPAAAHGGYPKRFGPVRSGVGLWRLALKNTPQGATAAQTAMALYRNNQGAFIDGDINRVILGKTLTIPSSAELFALDPDAAQREFQAALKGEEVRRAPIAPTGPVPEEGTSRLKIAGTAAQGPQPPAPSGPSEGAPAAESVEKQLLMVQETSETARQEADNLRQRVRDLEAQLSDIQKLLQLRNVELARMQGTAPGSEPASTRPVETPRESQGPLGEPLAQSGVHPPSEAGAPSAIPPGAQVPALGQTTSGAPPIETSKQATAPSGAVEKPPEGTAAPAQIAEGERPVKATEKRPTEPGSQGSKPSRPKSHEAAPVEAAGESLWRGPLLLLVGLAGLGGLGIGGLFWWRRRREVAGADLSSLAIAGSEGATPVSSRSVPAVTGPASQPRGDYQDLAAGSDQPTSSFVDAVRAETETDEADAISEADIYIAYGRFREAEDLLREEIERLPNRPDLKFKLAEVYFGAQKKKALTGLMDDMRASGLDRLDPDQWQRLMEMTSTKSESQPPVSGLASPAARPVPRVDAGAGSELYDSLDLGSKDTFSLDLGEGEGEAGEVEEHESPFGLTELGVEGPSALGEDKGRETVAPRVTGEPLLFDDDDLGGSHTLAPSSGSRGVTRRSAPKHGVDKRGAGADLDLVLDDFLGDDELNLDALIDTAPASVFGDESPSPRTVPSLDRPNSPQLRPVSSETAGGTDLTDLPTLTGAHGDSPSSDLLSSQWQMDSGLWDETGTKLELARAYLEMGDRESAKGILDEVMGEGSESQRNEARELLRRTG